MGPSKFYESEDFNYLAVLSEVSAITEPDYYKGVGFFQIFLKSGKDIRIDQGDKPKNIFLSDHCGLKISMIQFLNQA